MAQRRSPPAHPDLNLTCVTVLLNGPDDLDGDVASLQSIKALDDLAERPLTELRENLVAVLSASRIADPVTLSHNEVAVLVIDGQWSCGRLRLRLKSAFVHLCERGMDVSG